jgi:hypothetical protein
MLTLSWPSSAQDFVLEECNDLANSTSWSKVPAVPTAVGTKLQILIQPQPQHRFYRLQKIAQP